MRTPEEIRELVLSYVEGDPLYDVLRDTPQEKILFGDEYLKDIIEKRGYPLLEIAEWLGISDGQLRYYLRPFHDYIFEDIDSIHSNTNNVIRLNISAILKLRMLILLKEEYRVKGLKQLLGLDGEGYITRPAAIQRNEVSVNNEDELNEIKTSVANVQLIVQSMLESGIFRLSGGPENPRIELDDKNIEERIIGVLGHSEGGKLLIENLDEQKKILEEREQNLNARLIEVEQYKAMLEGTEKEVAASLEEVERIKKEYIDKINTFTELNKEKEDTVSAQLRKIELINELRSEALRKWNETKKFGALARLTKADKIEIEKEEFIKKYVEEEISKRL